MSDVSKLTVDSYITNCKVNQWYITHRWFVVYTILGACIVSCLKTWPEMPGHGALILMFLINAHHARALLIIYGGSMEVKFY